jgi:hypothetical protein
VGLINIPDLPAHFLPLPDVLDALKVQVLARTDKVGVQGMGGIGKTVLATVLALDTEVQRRFHHGVIWLTLGRLPDLVARQAQLAKALGDTAPNFIDTQDGRARLSVLLASKACLIVLDDVWNSEAIEAFNVLGPESRLLITTRSAELVTGLGAEPYPLDVLLEPQARQLLSDWSNQPKLPPQADLIIRECGRLPLALAIVGAMLRNKPLKRWDSVLRSLQEADLGKFSYPFPGYKEYPTLLAALEVSVEELAPALRMRYEALAVFPENTPIPVSAVNTLWMTQGLEEDTVEYDLDTLEGRSLLRRDHAGCVTLHNLQRDYLRVRAGTDLLVLHCRLLDAYRSKRSDGWASVSDDGYFFQFLPYHLKEAEKEEELKALLLDYA